MMKQTKAGIFAIGRHRIETDGSGIRTLVVFEGCPLRCKYCINPYTWNGEQTGIIHSPEMLLRKVSVDSVYFQATKGGITFGGGEPLLNAKFILDFINIAPASWNYTVETSLAVPFGNIRLIAGKIDTFVVDIKSMDAEIYRAYTGCELSLAITNLKLLIELVGAERIILRVPVIPGYADQQSQNYSAEQLRKLGISNIDLFTYKVN